MTVYRLASSFGLWNRDDLQVIMHPECGSRGSSERGCEHHSEMAEVLFDRPMETKYSPLWTSPPSPDTPICFKNLLVGTRQMGMSFPSEGQWASFVAEIKAHFGIPINPRLRHQKITILRKSGRRTWLNYEELAEHLRQRFGSQVAVEIIEPASLGMKEEISKLSKTTVLLSPCGGMSFSAMFLPPGASAVFSE